MSQTMKKILLTAAVLYLSKQVTEESWCIKNLPELMAALNLKRDDLYSSHAKSLLTLLNNIAKEDLLWV